MRATAKTYTDDFRSDAVALCRRGDRSVADAALQARVAAVHAESRHTYGSARVLRELRRDGLRVGKRRVERAMRSRGLRAAAKKAPPPRDDGRESRARRRAERSRAQLHGDAARMDARVPIDRGRFPAFRVERGRVALGRKNFLFVGNAGPRGYAAGVLSSTVTRGHAVAEASSRR